MDPTPEGKGPGGGSASGGGGVARGVHDPMDPSARTPALQAPWRMSYLESLGPEGEPGGGVGGVGGSGGGGSGGSGGGGGGADAGGGAASFLRDYWLAPAEDERNHVIVRTGAGMILLNAYPYSNGHLLVALGEGRPRLLDYDAGQRAALWRLVDAAAELMEVGLSPQGVNIGVNQGKASGAGVPGHLHVHLVPRWGGDINFMTVVARVRVIPASLDVMAKRYREAWGRIASRWAGVLGGGGGGGG